MVIEEDGIRYQIIQNKAIVIGFSKHHFGTCLSIPSIVDKNYTVTTIGGYAFKKDANLKSIQLPETITKIGEYAFCGCTELTAVYMKKSPQKSHYCKVERHAFAFCNNLQLIDMPVILFFAQQSCVYCKQLRHITGAIMYIGQSAFYDCKKIDRLFFADGAELFEDAINGAVIDYAIFLGNAEISDNTLKCFQNLNTNLQCSKTSNVVDLSYWGTKIKY